MKEIEIKVLGINKRVLERRIRALGGRRIGGGMMTVRHFDFPDGRLRAGGKLIRVRTVGCGTCEFAYKGPRIEIGKCKMREEIQTLVVNPKAVCRILQMAGMKETFYCEKKRTSWAVGKARIDIDKYPKGIIYAEIEGRSEKLVYGALERLGLRESEVSCETAEVLFNRKWPEIELNGLRF